MAFPCCLDPDCFDGEVNGISIIWTEVAKSRLPDNATILEVDLVLVKAATEHFACQTALRLGKSYVQIVYVFIPRFSIWLSSSILTTF